ncbi:MAG: hypothetical protein HON65_03315, partial [Rhodospirillales bacterium]|nr:hypothetical protein [Rhodospirillales bacterium]
DSPDAYLSVKHDQVVTLIKIYEKDCEDYDKVKNDGLTEQSNFLQDFSPTYKQLPELDLRAEILSKHIYEQITCDRRTLSLLGWLIRNGDSLNRFINRHNSTIEINRLGNKEKNQLLAEYFGYYGPNNKQDKTYGVTISGIEEYLDSCIYFSSQLCKELSNSADKIAKKIDSNALTCTPANFDIAVEKGLMPDPSLFSEFEDMFTEKESS